MKNLDLTQNASDTARDIEHQVRMEVLDEVAIMLSDNARDIEKLLYSKEGINIQCQARWQRSDKINRLRCRLITKSYTYWDIAGKLFSMRIDLHKNYLQS